MGSAPSDALATVNAPGANVAGRTDIPDQGLPVLPRGAAVPSDPAPQQPAQPTVAQFQQQYGPNYEKLPEKYVTALRQLVQMFASESDHARRAEIRRVKQAHQFWRGLHYLWWSERDQNWHLPFEQKMGSDDAGKDSEHYEFVTNIYQAFGLSIIAVLSQDKPTVIFMPTSAQAQDDVATAKAAGKINRLVERNNKIGKLVAEEAFHLWTGGKIGGYVRYVVDGQRFGFRTEQQPGPAQPQQLSPERYVCPQCSYAADSTDVQLNGGDDTCPQCGVPMQLQPALTVNVPTQVPVQVPNGQEVITIVGALELKTPPWCNDFYEYPYLQWNMETHKARLRAAYPHAADKIGPPVAPGASEQYERLARLGQSQGGPLTEGGGTNQALISFQRTWLRPWALYALDDKEMRTELLQMFPDGVYVAFAGEAYCESRNENMNDHWRVMHALPGDGTAAGRPAMGDSLIPVNEQLNTLNNLAQETEEQGIPISFIDSEVVDPDFIQGQTAEPGAIYPGHAKPGQPLAAGFWQSAGAEVSPTIVARVQALMGPIAQFLTGAFPALFGAEMAGNDTAAGYSMARDQAMGRIGLVWRQMKFFHADLAMLGVDCFRKNRPDDVEITVLGESKEFESQWVRLAELKGNISAWADEEEQYPTIWSQQRAVLMQLMASPDPMIAEVLSSPENVELVQRLLGMEDFTVPGTASHVKQMREIVQLLEGQPVQEVNPETQQPIMLPSIMPDDFCDNHAVELAACMEWFASDRGQMAKIEKPAGYANVRAHALMHQQMLQAKMMAQAAMMAPPEKGGKGKAGPEKGTQPGVAELPAPPTVQ